MHNYLLALCLVASTAYGQAVIPYSRMYDAEQLEQVAAAFNRLFESDPTIDPLLPKEIVQTAQAAVENYFCRDLDSEFEKINVKVLDIVKANNLMPVAGRFTPENMTIEMVYWPKGFSPAWHCTTLAHEYIHAIGYLLAGKLDADHSAYNYEKVEKYCEEELG